MTYDQDICAVLVTPSQRNIKLSVEDWPKEVTLKYEDVFNDIDGVATMLSRMYGLPVTVYVKTYAKANVSEES